MVYGVYGFRGRDEEVVVACCCVILLVVGARGDLVRKQLVFCLCVECYRRTAYVFLSSIRL